MTKVFFQVVRAHHNKFQEQFDRFTLEFEHNFFVESTDSFRHQLTGGMRPENQKSATEQRKELFRLSLTHVFHEVHCKLTIYYCS